MTLPELYASIGARFAFNAETLSEVVDFVEAKIAELSGNRSL